MLRRLYIYSGNPTYLSIGLTFFILSVLMAFWITRIPEVKSTLELSEGDLGIALFFVPLGGIVSMLLSAQLIKYIGEGRTTIYGLVAFSFIILLPVIATTFTLLCAALFVLGFAMGWVDIAMNAVVNTIEKKKKVSIMSTSHGFFSLGGIVGGALGGLLAEAGVSAFLHFMTIGALVFIFTFLVIKKNIGRVHDEGNKEESSFFVIPRSPVLGLAIIAFCIMIGEGVVADWSTVYLQDFLNTNATIAGFGYAGFSFTMTLGRFNGDYYTLRYGNLKVIVFGCIMALAGIVLLLLLNVWLVLLGFVCIGLGYSCVVPVLFSSAAKKEGVTPAYGLASVASAGYFGFLIGPVIIGLLAERYGLNNSFILLLILTTIALLSTKKALE
ncbi:MAG: MFS transporter [Bacteroidota bacterium]